MSQILTFGQLFFWYLSWFVFNRAVSESERIGGDNMIYKPVGENVPDMIYLGSLTNFDLTYAWAQDKCVPLVREITFENGEVGSQLRRRRGRGEAFFLFVLLQLILIGLSSRNSLKKDSPSSSCSTLMTTQRV